MSAYGKGRMLNVLSHASMRDQLCVQTVAIRNYKDTRNTYARPCTSHNKWSSSLPVNPCWQHMTSMIFRALHLSVERERERTVNIPNLNVSVLLDSMFNHSPLRFTCDISLVFHMQNGFLSNCNDTLIVQLSVSVCIQNLSFNLAGDGIDPNSFFHDLVVCFDRLAARLFIVTIILIRDLQTAQREVVCLHSFLACNQVPLHRVASHNIEPLFPWFVPLRPPELLLVSPRWDSLALLRFSSFLLESRQLSARFVHQLLPNANNLVTPRSHAFHIMSFSTEVTS